MKNYIYVSYSEYSEGGEICEGEENDDWPSYEDTQKHVTLESFSTKQPKTPYVEMVKVPFTPVAGRKYYAVDVRYTDCGTFASTHGYMCIPEIFESRLKAEVAAKKIRQGTYMPEQRYHPWTGYFGGLDSVEVIPFECET